MFIVVGTLDFPGKPSASPAIRAMTVMSLRIHKQAPDLHTKERPGVNIPAGLSLLKPWDWC